MHAPSRKTQFFVIFLTILLSTIGFGVCIPALPLYAEQFNATKPQIGMLIGVFSLMTFLTAPLWGKLSDRVGRRPVLLFSVLGSAFGYFLMGYANTLLLLFVARIIDGTTGGNVAAAQAYIADITKPEERSKAMGLIGGAFGVGFVMGPALGGILSKWSPHAPFYFVGILCLVNALLVFLFLPESISREDRQKRQADLPLRSLLQHTDSQVYLRALLTYFFSLVAFAIMTAIFALFGKERFALDADHLGYIMAAMGFIALFIQGGLIRRLLPRYGEVKLARLGMWILLVGFVLIPLSPNTTSMIWACCLVAIGNSLVQPTLNGLASRSASAKWQGRAMGVLQAFASLGRGIGALLGGWLLTFNSPSSYGYTPFWMAGVFMIITIIIAMGLRIPQEPADSSEAPAIQ